MNGFGGSFGAPWLYSWIVASGQLAFPIDEGTVIDLRIEESTDAVSLLATDRTSESLDISNLLELRLFLMLETSSVMSHLLTLWNAPRPADI